ncbi:MAG: HlyD family efflux transporter periplasmic adaptor subunit [Betaproteobacteria bacterium]|nr:HlyD family efflux transporter periplasmic adaptor subunit [Betaproteobacteria bacterium]MBU6512201.1 HlyD family efflux transporter periplasmic adaptor subunit [Betaproteobacteria bacterium]MDE1956019.1 HlyD family efflux transporter periplasmic adaptor subunit [Betaproteobacteria bacterium]MDE2153893.1 HlyD family efflux transporter periplasmic adaptor subunit [Betaproteobacteria bacterium]MDE2479958.1 HlyD family efflux transporter periplasmic adaptor subunit [Betaproteobacteria bacterium
MSANPQSNNPTPNGEADAKAARRRKLMLGAIGTFVVLGVVYGGYQYWQSTREVNTDDAYVNGNLVQVTPQVGGTVTEIGADDTQVVRAGQTLVRLDGADARVALQQAEAQLGQAVRGLRVTYAQTAALQSQVAVRETDVATARANLAKAEDALQRRRKLAGTGAVGAEELRQAQIAVQEAQSSLQTAQSGVKAARAQVAANEAQTAGTVLAHNPAVRLAAARVRQAYLALERTDVVAPVSGVVARRTVQLGQRVAPGTPLMTVVPLDTLWVDANFKETQLRELRIGQPATVVADIYGSHVSYDGKVVGISAGSGSAFALLPAQNATGNWIKVVQRLPVRIALDPAELRKHPLRVGLSTETTVDIRDHSGTPVIGLAPTQPVAQTDMYAANWAKADKLVARIIAENVGGMPAAEVGLHAARAARR